MSSIHPVGVSTLTTEAFSRTIDSVANHRLDIVFAGAVSLVPPGNALSGASSISNATSSALSTLSRGWVTAAVEGQRSTTAGLSRPVSPHASPSAEPPIPLPTKAIAVTSPQLPAGIYGSNLTEVQNANSETTFTTAMSELEHVVASLDRLAGDLSVSASERQNAALLAQQAATLAASEQTAYDTHTLDFQKAAGSQGANSQGTIHSTAMANKGETPPQALGVT